MYKLRPMHKSDLFWHRQYVSKADIQEQMLGEVTGEFNIDSVRQWYNKLCSDHTTLVYSIVDIKVQRYIGFLSFYSIDWNSLSGWITVMIGPEEIRYRGIGRQIIGDFCQYGFLELGLETIIADIYKSNAPAIRSFEAVGFCHVGNSPYNNEKARLCLQREGELRCHQYGLAKF